MAVDLTDAQAARRAAGGDADAFMTLVHRYRAPIIAFIHGRIRRRDEAEDLAQEVFCRAWEHLPRLREPAAFAGWLYRIAANAIVSDGRQLRPASLETEPPQPVESNCDHSLDVHAAVGALAEEFRIVVSLRYFSGLSTEQIAEVLGIKAGTVRSRLSRAYGQLRVHLASEVEA